MTIFDYFAALKRGEKVTDSQTVEMSRAKWDSFNADRHPDLAKATATIRKWYKERITCGGGLILAGGYGCGKTHLARAIYELYGFRALFWEELGLIKSIQSGYSGRGQSEDSLFAQARRAELLIYDDLGSYETDNLAFVQNIYRGLFDGRLETNKATLVTTNLRATTDSDEVSEFERRVGGKNFSRLVGQLEVSEFYIDLFDVPDYRLRNFKSRK